MLFPPVIINGFDRSGTSAITRVLSNHPIIELIMQPFNSGLLRNKMYEIFNEEGTNEVSEFLLALNNGEIKEEYIHSHWHFQFSTTREYKENKLHTIKTTINHFAQKWIKEQFPAVDVWGIWRNPQEILTSLFNNGFYEKWYGDAITQIIPTVLSTDILKQFTAYIEDLDSDIKKASFLIAVRSYFFFYYLDHEKWIDYAKFREDANYLNHFIKFYGLEPMDFNEYSKVDLNIIGKKSTNELKFSSSELDFMNKIFNPLIKLKHSKSNDKIS